MQGIPRLGYGGVEIGMLLLLALLGWWRGDRGLRNRGLVGAAVAIVSVALLLGPTVIRAQDPESDVYVARGILEYDEKNYEAALQAFSLALRLDPDNVDALYYSGLVRIVQEQYAEAAKSLEQARTKDPSDRNIAFHLGLAYFSQGDSDRADPLFLEVYAAEPRRENLGYYLGFIRYQRRDFDGAARYLRANVSRDPAYRQLASLYLGLAETGLGLRTEAQVRFEEVLRLDPLSPLTAPAQRIREAILAARREERRFRLEARVNVYADSNVRVIPSENPEDLQVVDLRNNKTRSTGNLFFLRGDYDVVRTEHHTATVTASLLQTLNHQLPDFNIQNVLGGATYAYQDTWGGMPYFVGLQYAYDFLTLETRKLAQRHSVTPFGTLVEDAGNMTAMTLRYQFKDFFRERGLITSGLEGAEDRDATNLMAGLTHFFRFEADRHFIRLGYQFDDETAQGANWSYYGHRVIAGFRYTMEYDIRLDVSFEYHDRRYRHINTIYGRRRHDFDQNYLVSMSRDVPWMPWGSLTVALEYLFNKNNSTIPVFDYSRHVVSLGLIWRY